jgi:phytoene synthase
MLDTRLDLELPDDEPIGPGAVAAAYPVCRELTRHASKTFYLASNFLEPEKRRAVWAVYAFCRTADDIVDRIAPAGERLAAIADLEGRLVAANRGFAREPIFIAYADAVRRYGIPLEPALALLRGARLDVTVRRYESYDQLLEYCYLVASTVGLLVSPILGYTSPEALEYGITLGRAMQLTNILRDVGEDARMGRIYLPAEDLQRFGYSEASLMNGEINDAFVALMQFYFARVRELYTQAEPGIAMLNADSRYTVRLALKLYSGILKEIEANGYDVFTKRAYVPLRSKLLGALALALSRG